MFGRLGMAKPPKTIHEELLSLWAQTLAASPINIFCEEMDWTAIRFFGKKEILEIPHGCRFAALSVLSVVITLLND